MNRSVRLLLQKKADPKTAELQRQDANMLRGRPRFRHRRSRASRSIGIDVNARYGNNLTDLMWVAGHEDGAGWNDVADIIALLIDHGARLNDQDNRGRTALMIAASLGHEKAVEILLARGADKGLHDKAGKTAIDLSANDELRMKLASN